MKHVVIMGGGVAGLAAALRLSRSAGRSSLPPRITLLEASPKLGGRVYSFAHALSDSPLDNGQHVLMGCCVAAIEYLREVGHEQNVERLRGLALPFFRADGARSRLEAGTLPHPLGMVQAFLRYDMLSLPDRLRILRVALRLRSMKETDLAALDAMSCEAWLRSMGQSPAAIDYFWHPVILATLNADHERASAKLLAVVLREIFLSTPEAADVLLPAAPLGELFIDPAAHLLELRGVELRLHAPAETLRIDGDRCIGVEMKDGAFLEADAVMSAMPAWALRRVLEQTEASTALQVKYDSFLPSEILSVHFWTSRDLDAGSMSGLLDTKLQWLFAKGRESDGRYRYSCTVSAAGDDVPRSAGELRPLLLEELRLICPDLAGDELLDLLPLREKRATFVPAAGLEVVRPCAETAIQGLFLAGDWTATGFPATIEGAIRSGYAAAESILTLFAGNQS